VNKKPDQFNYKHSITHHEIYVCVEKSKNKPITKSKNSLFIKPENLAKKSPFSLMKKALQFI
jgi:type IV secretory pathway VirB9-like protein